MAVNPNQSYAETLREMRATRMQQLRQGSSQAQIMNKQMSTMSAMNTLLQKQAQMISRLEGSQRAGNQQLVSVNRNLNNLSTTLSRSLSNFATTVAIGAGRGASAVGGAVVSTAGAAGSVATSIASGVAKVLPVAIAGYVIKAVSWDNMSQKTRDDISGSMGDMFSGAMKEINSTEIGNAITKALTPAFNQISKLTERLGQKVGDTADAIKDKLPSASEVADSVNEAIPKIQKGAKRLKIGAEARFETTKDIFEDVSRVLPDQVPGLPGVSPGAVVTTLGTAAIVAGAAKIAGPSASSTATPKANFGNFKTRPPSKATEEGLKIMKQNPKLVKKEGLLAARLIFRASSGVGAASKFMQAFTKYKLAAGGAFVVLGAVLHYWDFKVVKKEIELMAEEGIFTQEEVDFLVGRLRAEDWAKFFGGAIAGTAGAVGGSVFGPGGTVVGGLAGGYVGSEFAGSAATAAYEKFNPRPASLNEDITESSFMGTSSMVNQGFDTRYSNVDKPQASMTTPNIGDLPYTDKDAYREVVGKYEGAGLGYDAVYGAYNKADMEKYMATEGAKGKKVSEMTIEEALEFARTRGKNAGALGKYQFMPTTLEGLYKKAGLKKTDLFNAKNQDILFDKFTELNGEGLKKAGLKVTAFNLRLAHAVGLGGATKLLKADPNAVPADVMGFAEGSAAYKTNPQLHSEKGGKRNVTVASYMARLQKQFGTSMAGDTQMASNYIKPDAATASPAVQAAGPESIEQKPAEMTEKEKREKKVSDMFKNTMAAMSPEKLQSDLLETLELAKTMMMGKGDGGGTTINNIDNSSSSALSSGGGNGGGKSTSPDVHKNNFEHRAMTGVMI